MIGGGLRYSRAFGWVSLLTAVSVLAAGCSDDHGADTPLSSEPTEDPLPSGADFKSQYPVGQEWRHSVTWGTDSDYYRSGFALYQSAIEVCMAARGFDYVKAPWYDDDVVSVVTNPLNEKAAQEYGYHMPPYGAVDVSIQNDDSEAFGEAMNGSGATYSAEGGCGDLGFEFAYGGVATDASAVFDSIVAGASAAIDGYAATDDGRRSVNQWAQCMSGQGYTYTTPLDPDTEFSGSDGPTQDEIRVRMADLACDRQVGLTAARSSYEQAGFAEWLDLNAPVVHDYELLLNRAKEQVGSRTENLVSRGFQAVLSATRTTEP